MPYWDWDFYEQKPRREAKDGIKAKSQRGSIGESWWSKRFIAILESFNIGARLSRGRSYARSGQVMNLEIKSGAVSAQVQGSSYRPYKIQIKIKSFSENDWSRIEQYLADQALFLAKLLAGEMPHEIEEAFTACNLNLFPSSGRDIESDCSCPDWSNPCKHIAATYYILAEKFDENPFLIFAWRGREKEDIIESLRALRSSTAEDEDESFDTESQPFFEEAAPLEESINNFWKAASEISDLQIRPRIAEVPDAILKQLGPLNIEARGKSLTELLSPVYKAMTTGAAAKAIDD